MDIAKRIIHLGGYQPVSQIIRSRFFCGCYIRLVVPVDVESRFTASCLGYAVAFVDLLMSVEETDPTSDGLSLEKAITFQSCLRLLLRIIDFFI
jgi:hypothetical protein